MIKKSGRWLWKEWIRPLLPIVLLVSSVRSSVADWNHVPTGSMKPTILEGDRVIVNKLAYDLKLPFTTWHLAEWSHPNRGDIVVFFSPTDRTRLVKRVIGLPGDTIAMENNHLIINGKPLAYEALNTKFSDWIEAKERVSHEFAAEKLSEAPHPVMATSGLAAIRSFAPVTVPTGEYFMMGDNRDNSLDSRYFGTVPRSKIVGRAEAVAFSVDRDHYYLPRSGRSGIKFSSGNSPESTPQFSDRHSFASCSTGFCF